MMESMPSQMMKIIIIVLTVDVLMKITLLTG